LGEPTEGAQETQEEAKEDQNNNKDHGEVSDRPGCHLGNHRLTAVHLVCRFTVWPGTVDTPVTEKFFPNTLGGIPALTIE